MPFQKAVKYGSKLRLALAGPSGSGKTYTALTLACALAGDKPVAVIDTERGSASKYARTKDGQGFDFVQSDFAHQGSGISEAAARAATATERRTGQASAATAAALSCRV